MNRCSLQNNTDINHSLGDYDLESHKLSYNELFPRIYNYCKSLGFEMNKIMPSQAFCSDENQGYPIILMAKHFGIFPFNHGRVGGIMAAVRHAPYASHGKDMFIIQASHVGYIPEEQSFGQYRRIRTEHKDNSLSCAKIASVVDWYQHEYDFAKTTVFLQKKGGENYIVVDNQLIDKSIEKGLILRMDRIADNNNGDFIPHHSYSTSKCFKASAEISHLFDMPEGKRPIGDDLLPELFCFKRELDPIIEGVNMVEHNLLPYMPWIVSSRSPLLTAAKVNVQVEFDRIFRTIVKEKAYHGKRLVYLAGLNIDISPDADQIFPTTMFVPWAMYVQTPDGEHEIIEQHRVVEILKQQSTENPDQIDLDEVINMMERTKEVKAEE